MRVYLKDMTVEEIIGRLRDGEFIHEEYTNNITLMINGVICRSEGDNYYIGSYIYTGSNYYFETSEHFKITETGLYKTRDGRKVLVSKIYDSEKITYKVLGLIEGDSDTTTWTVEGFESDSNESKDDIVAKWED